MTRCSALSSRDDATRKLRSGSRDPRLRVEGLSAQFPVKQGLLRRTVGQVWALDRVDLRVLRGQTLSVVGESGSGKTTLARSLACLVPASAGKLLFDGKDLLKLGKAELRQALRQLALVTPETFAGPEALTALVAPELKLLIFDEAFDALDAAAWQRIASELRRWQDEQGLSCLVLTRSLELASVLSDEVLVLHAGQIVEAGSTLSLIQHPRHPYTESLLGASGPAAPSPAPAAGAPGRPPGCLFRARCPQAFARCAVESPALFAVPGGLSRCLLHDPEATGV